jgi:hypothetical protein
LHQLPLFHLFNGFPAPTLACAAPVASPAGAPGSSSGVPAVYPDTDAARFFINLAVCNTVIPQVLEDGRFVYQVSPSLMQSDTNHISRHKCPVRICNSVTVPTFHGRLAVSAAHALSLATTTSAQMACC